MLDNTVSNYYLSLLVRQNQWCAVLRTCPPGKKKFRFVAFANFPSANTPTWHGKLLMGHHEVQT